MKKPFVISIAAMSGGGKTTIITALGLLMLRQ
jgi:uridine kinase